MSAQQEFETKLEAIREARMESNTATRLRSDAAINDVLMREAVTDLSALIHKVGAIAELDEDSLDASIKLARRSEYGRIPQMLSKICSIYAWPVDSVADAKEIPERQEEILEVLNKYSNHNIDDDLLMDLKESKGSHTFMDSKTKEVVDAKEPMFEEFAYYVTTLADYLGVPIVDNKLDEAKWHKAEAKAIAKIAKEQEEDEIALAAHKALMEASA